MICFHTPCGSTRRGLLLQRDGEQLYVLISPETDDGSNAKALVSDQLLKEITLGKHVFLNQADQKMYLLECDVDHRSEIWLMPLSPATAADALVLASWWAGYRNRTKANVTISAREPVRIFGEHGYRGIWFRFGLGSNALSVSSHAVLAQMPPGSSLIFETTTTKRPHFLQSLFQQRLPETTRDVFFRKWNGRQLVKL